MKIDKDSVVTIRYKVSNTQGVVLEAPKEPTSYLHGGHGNTLAKIEEALQGQEKGFATTLDLRAYSTPIPPPIPVQTLPAIPDETRHPLHSKPYRPFQSKVGHPFQNKPATQAG